MKKQTIGVGIVALLAGAAVGYLVHGGAPASEAPAAEVPVTRGAIATVADAESNALRQRVKALEAQLAAALAATPAVVTQEMSRIDFPRDEKDRKRFGEAMKARFEEWKKNNPEEFAKMEKRRQEFMQRRAEKAKSRLDFLASIDTSKMSEGEKDVHEKIQSLLTKREELEAKMQDENLTDEERDQLMADMHDTSRAIRDANAQEREVLFKQTAEALGFEGEDVGEIAQTLKDVVEATSGDGHGGHGPGGPGGGPGGPGGGPGGPGGGR